MLNPKQNQCEETHNNSRSGDVRAFALIACQRSGTHLLRQVLNTNPFLALLEEPFSVKSDPILWCNFIRELPASEYPAMNTEGAANHIDRYLRAIQHDTRCRREVYGGYKSWVTVIGLDIKYNQLKSANPLFNDLLARPFLLDYFRARRIPIFHLVRNNVAHCAISIVIANARNVFHNQTGVPFVGKYRIAPLELINYMRWIRNERAEFLRLSHDLDVTTLSYEDLVEDIQSAQATGVIPKGSRVLSRIADCLSVSNEFSTVGCMHKVINKPYADILENYDEIVGTIRDSEFAEFATTLGPQMSDGTMVPPAVIAMPHETPRAIDERLSA